MRLRQEKAISELLVNGGNVTKAMLKAGYSKNTANTPQKLTQSKAFKETVDPIVRMMQAEREAILKRLPKVRAKAKYRDLIDGADKMTKNIQLLTGGKTANVGVDEETAETMNAALASFLNNANNTRGTHK